MRTIAKLALTLITVAAGGCSHPAPPPRGYAAHMAAADEHSRRADAHRQAAAGHNRNPDNYQCGDAGPPGWNDQLTSGGERLVPQIPCWDPTDEAAERHRVVAAREQDRARRERRAAAGLVEAELAACRGISPDEVEHSPFAHRKAIAEVIPHREGSSVRGVRIVFKPVLGLSPEWMKQAITCHRARYERLGEPPTYLSDDPTLVPGATTTVSVHNGRIEVLVETHDEVAANVALGRAEELVRPRTAGR
jgi:hypothetical protein